MRYASAFDFKWAASSRWLTGLALLPLVFGLLMGCGGGKPAKDKNQPQRTFQANGEERPVLLTRHGDTLIQVVESTVNGEQIVRVRTVIDGKESITVIHIDQPTYQLEIPLGPLRPPPPGAKGAAGTGQPGAPGGLAAVPAPSPIDLQKLQVTEALDKARQEMVNGDYLAAMRQVDIVLRLNSNHIQARAMKGSIYYALGDNQLANTEWNRVLLLDPGNTEVQGFQEFIRRNPGVPPPPLPGRAPLQKKTVKPPSGK